MYAALANAQDRGARADWKYTTALLALDRPLYRPLQEDAPEVDQWGHFRWAEAAGHAEQLGDLELALAVRERYRPRRACGLDLAPEYAARAYADLCYRMGRWACFLNLRVRLMGEDLIEGIDSTWAERMRKVGIDVERFLRGLLYQFPAPGLSEGRWNHDSSPGPCARPAWPLPWPPGSLWKRPAGISTNSTAPGRRRRWPSCGSKPK